MSDLLGRLGGAAFLAALGVVLAALALGFSAFAAFLALSAIWPSWLAALAVAGGALMLAALALWMAARHAEKTAHEAEAAIKSQILVRAAPLALKFALGRPRLIASLLAALGALAALLKAFDSKPKA